MFITFESNTESKSIDTTILCGTSIEEICNMLFPEYYYRDGALYEKTVSKGYIYNSVKERRVYSVKVSYLDETLQTQLDEILMYSSPLIEDSERDEEGESEGEEIEATQQTFGFGYSPNLITNTFCGFGFNPCL